MLGVWHEGRGVSEAISLRVEKGEMKNFCIAVLLVVMAGFCFGQAPGVLAECSETDVYVGYMTTSPDYGPGLFRYRFNGFEGAFSKGAELSSRDWLPPVSFSFGTILCTREAIFGHGGRPSTTLRPAASVRTARAGWLRASELERHVRQ